MGDMMKQVRSALLVFAALQGVAFGQQRDLEAGFHNPPQSARPLTFWMWINGNVSREGITADLEAFKRVGLAGTEQFLIGGGADSGVPESLDDPSGEVFGGEVGRGRSILRRRSRHLRLGFEFGTHSSCGVVVSSEVGRGSSPSSRCRR